jgi:hypothetical protein
MDLVHHFDDNPSTHSSLELPIIVQHFIRQNIALTQTHHHINTER